MKKIRFGIVGYGFIGHIHEDTLTRKIADTEVTAICDICEEKLAHTVSSAKTFTDVDELLRQDDVDVVLIAVPNHLHCEFVKKAAKAGKDIICEKPVALNTVELDEMIAAVRKAGVKFTVHQQRRFDNDFASMKKVYDSGELGRVYTVQSKLCGFNGYMHDWHKQKAYGGGMLYDWGVHLIDQILYMVDSRISTVYADVRNVINDEVDDYFKIQLRFENGVSAEIELGTYLLTDKENWFEHHWFMGGDKGAAYCDGFIPQGAVVTTRSLMQKAPDIKTAGSSGPTRSFGTPEEGLIQAKDIPHLNLEHKMYFENYVKAYRGDGNFLVQIPEVRRVLALMETIRESAERGTSIEFVYDKQN